MACAGILLFTDCASGQTTVRFDHRLTLKADTQKHMLFLKSGNLKKPALGKYDYYNSLGLACKAELKLQRVTKIPFRFRLGSLQLTDYLEGKPNTQKPE